MKQKKRSSDVSLDPFAVNTTSGCGRKLPSQSLNGITRSLATAEKDPTVHPETPRNNPNPG